MLRESTYHYECMDNWDRLKEVTVPSKEKFYSNINMEGITDSYSNHASNKVYRAFHAKTLGKYLDLYVKSAQHY